MFSSARRDAAIVLGVVLLDLATKAAVLALLPLGASVDLLGGFVRLTSVRNVGAAFGLLAGVRWAGLLFTCVTAAAIAALLLYRRGLPPEAAAQRLGLHLVLGGAAGNLVDRLRFGHVVDFVDVGLGGWRWPAFNVADSAITIGVMILLFAPARRGAAGPATEERA